MDPSFQYALITSVGLLAGGTASSCMLNRTLTPAASKSAQPGSTRLTWAGHLIAVYGVAMNDLPAAARRTLD